MAEIDLRGHPYLRGYPRHDSTIGRELYTLLTVFAASPTIAARAKAAGDNSVYMITLREYEFVEVGRVLISLAAMLRNELDANPQRIESLESMPGDTADEKRRKLDEVAVGTLVPDLRRPTRTQPLGLRTSFNKIIHAATMNPDRNESGPSIFDGHLNPLVHLYGELNGTEWKASIDIFDWAEAVHFWCDW